MAKLHPVQALQLGLQVRDYQEANNLTEDFKIDYDAAGKALMGRK